MVIASSFLDELLDDLADRVAARLRAPDQLVDQKGSPLGAKRHCAAVRRLMAEGDPGASRVGRRYLLSREALAAELARLGRPAAPSSGVCAELAAELGL
jgi:hypothetical protein